MNQFYEDIKNGLIKSGTECWTGYPFVELGDNPHYQQTPIRKVIFLAFDNNKYCDILLPAEREYSEQKSSLKAGYLFATETEALEFENECKKYKRYYAAGSN